MAEDPLQLIGEIMATTVTVMKNGKPTTMTVARVIAEKTIADATSGSPRALKQRLDFLERIRSWNKPAEPVEEADRVDYEAIVRAKLEDMAQRQKERRREDRERKRQGLPPLYKTDDEDDD